MKKLLNIPAVIPAPPPETILRNLEWANEDPELMVRQDLYQDTKRYDKRHSNVVKSLHFGNICNTSLTNFELIRLRNAKGKLVFSRINLA